MVCLRYSVMTRCWHETPEFRPPFDNLRRRMIKYIEEEVRSLTAVACI